ncbi:MAG: hypothetical protein AOA65_1705 [Candidatus Bathyarchaeota archaeon BA1]|nr:MAG: hypothetical protein AOA65_1705 [Candidatus Bathyarchaeota archaeon BA1]
MEKKEFFKREDLKKKLVIAADTTIVGEVTDIVFSPDGKVWPLIESKTPPPTPPPLREKECPRCGWKSKPPAKFCIKCG